MDPPGLAAGEELGTEQSAAAVYEELCRILFGSVEKKKKQPVPAEKPVASVNTWRIEQNQGAGLGNMEKRFMGFLQIS